MNEEELFTQLFFFVYVTLSVNAGYVQFLLNVLSESPDKTLLNSCEGHSTFLPFFLSFDIHADIGIVFLQFLGAVVHITFVGALPGQALSPE